MDFHVLRSPEFENHIFTSWSMCMNVCVISITQRQIAVETSNLVCDDTFGSCRNVKSGNFGCVLKILNINAFVLKEILKIIIKFSNIF